MGAITLAGQGSGKGASGKTQRLSWLSVVAAAALFAGSVFAASCGKADSGDRLKVAATIAPLADFCRQVGGGRVEVIVLVPPGASPHTFEPTSEQMKFLSESALFVRNGLELESWAADMAGKLGRTDMVEVVAADAVPAGELIRATGDHGGDDGVYDPHVWLDPNLATYQVGAIRDGLIDADPEGRDEYRRNAANYIERLGELDRWVEGRTSTFTDRKYVSFHPDFTYFARRYSLEQVGVVEGLPGKEPGAGEMAELIDNIRSKNVHVVFTEPQFDPKAAFVIAAEAGPGVEVRALDPLGDPGDPETGTYIKLIEHDVGIMAEVMK